MEKEEKEFRKKFKVCLSLSLSLTYIKLSLKKKTLHTVLAPFVQLHFLLWNVDL